MRSPLWIGLLSVAGSTFTALPALAQEAKPDGGAAPAPGVAPAEASVPIVVDPAAKKALEDAAQAVKDLGPCTFTIEMHMDGMKDFKFESTMKVKMIRGKAAGQHAYQMMGDFFVPGGDGDPVVKATLFEGKTGEWIDDKNKTLFIRPVKSTATDPASKNVLNKCMTPNKAFEVLLLETNPFKDELDDKTTSLSMEKSEKVGDEECQVIKATRGTKPNSASYRYIYVSALDKLPRKYVQVMGLPGTQQQVRRFEIKDLNTESKVSLDDLHLKLPDGYKLDKMDPPPPPPPAPPAPAKEKGDRVKEKEKGDPSKEKIDPAKQKELQKLKDKEKEKELQKLSPEEREKLKKEEEELRAKTADDPNVVPAPAKPGKK
ncbi:MAG: hypothetical protein QM783_18035 [Phycisphaerales bacterium]